MGKTKKMESATVGFETVFADELESIRTRHRRRSQPHDYEPREEGLPDFEAYLVDRHGGDPKRPKEITEDQRTETLNQVLRGLGARKGDEESERVEDTWKQVEEQRLEAGQPFHRGLVGLAFSGGGIRSATFNLGILQGLQRIGLFDCVDYLSTVSGGGFLGSCLSSVYASRDTPEFPFEHAQGKPERPIFRHLRNNANYLAPGGILDYLQIPMLLLRGIIINAIILITYVLAAAAVYVGLFFEGGAFQNNAFFFSKITGILLLVALVSYPIIHLFFQERSWVFKDTWHARAFFGRFLGFLLALGLVLAFLEAQPYIIQWVHARKETMWSISIGTGAGTLLMGLASDKLLRLVSAVWKKIGIYLIALLAFFAFWGLFLSLCEYAILNWENTTSTDLPLWDWKVPLALVYAIAFVSLWMYGMIFDLNYTSMHNFYRDRLSKAYLVDISEGKDGVTVIDPNDMLKLSMLSGGRPEVTKQSHGKDGGPAPGGKGDRESASSSGESSKLKEKPDEETRKPMLGPYHLVNTAINIQNFKEEYKRGRHSDFFLFSPQYIGSLPTGYCRTKSMENVSRHVNLGTAMAISGAAAAPNAGKNTSRPLRFILSLLNVRLNYWLPNPAWACKIGKKKVIRNPMTRVGPIYLLKEMFGRLKADSWNVNLSDGGHLENLGVYELLRRECRLILVGDGERDLALRFEGLTELIRMAQIDLGIKIEMEGLDEIRSGAQQHAVGTIHYSCGRIGKMIYFKSCLMGDDALVATMGENAYLSSPNREDNRRFDDNPYLSHYKMRSPDFPHESTADQFFDEQQFECYRALGYKVATQALWR